MNKQELLQAIEPYKLPQGGYNISKMEKDFGIARSFADTFFADSIQDDDPRVALAVEINGRLYDEEKASEKVATKAALQHALNGSGNEADWQLLEKRGLAVAEYRDPESNAITGYHLRGDRDIDGNIYSDQADIEANPGRL
jgi:hypothetical protein